MGRGPDRVFDEYLVALARSGSRAALGRLAERWTPRLLAYAARSLGDAEAARDVVQETWASAIPGLARLDDPARFPGWIFGIATRRCADALRAKIRGRRLVNGVAAAGLETAVSPPAGEGIDLAAAIAALPAEARALVGLYYGEGLTVEEIAEALALPPGTVKSRLFQARARLKQHFEGGSP